jgi:hypothetical protein
MWALLERPALQEQQEMSDLQERPERLDLQARPAQQAQLVLKVYRVFKAFRVNKEIPA